ncbi:hypothetical protein WID48_25560 [Enterobacter hormaechei]
MSRSRRKTPIVGHTTCGSEREDKKLWHQRWRTRERTALTSASPEALSAHLPLLENQASSVWWHCCKVSDEAAFCLIQRPYISKTLLTRRISPRGSP